MAASASPEAERARETSASDGKRLRRTRLNRRRNPLREDTADGPDAPRPGTEP